MVDFAKKLQEMRRAEAPSNLEHDDRRTGTERRCAATYEVPPTGTGKVVLDWVIAKIDSWQENVNNERTSGLQAVREDLIARAVMGEKKYGTKLRTENGRRAAVDTYQELLDAIMYASQARMEKSGSVAGGFVEVLLELARHLAVELDKQ